jgi:hypothetical protein
MLRNKIRYEYSLDAGISCLAERVNVNRSESWEKMSGLLAFCL